MTKREMIAAIQFAEAVAWKRFNNNKAVLGAADEITMRSRSAWAAVHDVMKAMKVSGMPMEELIAKNLLPEL